MTLRLVYTIITNLKKKTNLSTGSNSWDYTGISSFQNKKESSKSGDPVERYG